MNQINSLFMTNNQYKMTKQNEPNEQKKLYNLEELYYEFKTVLECDDIPNVLLLKDTLEKYIGDDWKKHIASNTDIDGLNTYNKKLIFRSEILDMFIITWPPHSESKIHDHPEYGCTMKILCGELLEDEYAYISESPCYVRTNNLSCNMINFKKGKEMLHKIKNVSNDVVVSLHLYSKGEYKMCVYN
jgi:hypothetical protein